MNKDFPTRCDETRFELSGMFVAVEELIGELHRLEVDMHKQLGPVSDTIPTASIALSQMREVAGTAAHLKQRLTDTDNALHFLSDYLKLHKDKLENPKP